MKRLLTYVLILGGVMLAALSGCQKEEEIFDSSRFYAYSTPISPFTATVVSYLQKQDDSTHLSVAISKRYGFPVWNKAQYVKSGNKVLLFVPLAKNEEKSVGGVWYFTQEENSISYRVLGNNPSQAGFDQYFWMIDYFNQVLFANSVYQYKSPKTNGYLKTEASDGLFITRCVDTFINDYFTGTHCWDVFNDGNGDGSLGATDLSGNGDNFTPPSGGSTNPSDPNPNSELIPDSQLELLSPHEKANTQLAWMDTHGGKDVVTAILKVAYATGLTESDKTKIYQAIDVAYKSLKAQYIMAVFRPVAETLKPVLELALINNASYALIKGVLESIKTISGAADFLNFSNTAKIVGGLKPLELGSTGRTAASNLSEVLAMKEIMSNPLRGAVIENIKPLTDTRWLGWRKMQYEHISLDGSKIVIHYNGKWENGILKAIDDFKFISQ